MDIYQEEIVKAFKKMGFDGIKVERPSDPSLGDFAIPCFFGIRPFNRVNHRPDP